MTIKRIPLLSGPYARLRDLKRASATQRNLEGAYVFDNRSQGHDKACVMLAGYKPYLYPYVFPRLKRHVPQDVDVCIVTAGKTVEPLRMLCAEAGWSYVGTRDNNVSLAQNIAFSLMADARLLFKMDEDIFVTEGLFEGLLAAREHSLEGPYRPGPIAPLIPVNGFCHLHVLRRFDALNTYIERFGEPVIAADPSRPIESNGEAAQFMWGATGHVPHIDEMARVVATDPQREVPCAIRFSIGCILLERAMWEDMGFFDVAHGFVGLGLDERQLCSWATINSRPIMVSDNVVAGHFGFGQQNEDMRVFLMEHPECFEMLDER